MKNKIKEIIVSKDLSIRQVAIKADIHEQTITNWIHDRNLGQIKNFYRMCKILKTDIKEIFIEKEED